MAESSVPVPVWNSRLGAWEAVDFRNGQRVVSWPDGFNPQLLPTPEYQEGDRVQFVRDECCAREGMVRLVLFQGDISRLYEGRDDTGRELMVDEVYYVITARGHDHRVRTSAILGRFVPLERVSRVLPLQE